MRRSLFLAVLCSILIATAAIAAGPVPSTIVNSSLSGVSTVNTTWTGVGGGIQLNTSYLNPDTSLGAGATVNNFGGSYSGSAAFRSVGDNPYSYGVGSTQTTVQAGYVGSGSAELVFDRTASYSPMYGPAGQNVQGFVGSSGTGEMALSISTNYAALGVGNYGKPTTTNGRQFEATGDFTVLHSVTDGAGQGGQLVNYGTGTTQINAMSSDVGGGSFNFGAGQGCYTNAKVLATGSGVMQLTAGAQDQLRVDNIGLVIPGGGAGAGYLMQATYNGATVANPFSYGNWSISGQ